MIRRYPEKDICPGFPGPGPGPRRIVACGLLIAGGLVAACGPSGAADEDPAGTEWVGQISTEGGLTTVLNSGGSVWGGPARLVEEASIGVLEGEDPYMFGYVSSVWATDERIFVSDAQAPAVRVYDWDGQYLMDVGGAGEGPGEYEQPLGVAVAAGGEIWVMEANLKLHRYTEDGEPIGTYPSTSGITLFMDNAFIMGPERPYVAAFDMSRREDNGFPETGRAPVLEDGSLGELMYPPDTGFEPWCLEYTHQRSGQLDTACRVPHAPWEISVLTSAGEWVVGVGTEYGFDRHGRDGERLRVERHWDPVPVGPEETDYERLRTRAYIRNFAPGWTWDGPEIPSHKRAFDRIVVDRDGRFWVTRQLASRRVEQACTEEFPNPEIYYDHVPCWVADSVVDGFGPDGRYLGEVHPPETLHGREPYIRGDVWITPVIDEEGTVRVKRYRLVLPGDSQTD